MRYYRTPEKQRTTYKQYDENGRIIAEFDPEKDTTMDVTIDVKEKIVKMMHAVDDAEVKRNNKERKLDPYTQKLYDEEKERFIKNYREKYGYDPRKEELPEGSHRSLISIDAPVEAAGGETLSEILPDERASFFEDANSPATYMDELIETDLFDDRDRIIYDCKIRRNMTDKATGAEIGKTGQYVGILWKRIQEKIMNDAGMRNFYRM
ncbi:MAG: hypothetical protein E7307_01535 [Butyrivibrio sp.]|nr:hypothetical protein [Butyrivibrio sp.]